MSHEPHNGAPDGADSAESARLRTRIAELERITATLQQTVLPLGIALSAEDNFDRLLERIVREARAICNADMGLLYLRDGDRLHYVIDQTASLGIHLGGVEGGPVPYPALPLPADFDGTADGRHAAVYVALTGRSVNTPDIYADTVFDFSSTRQFDAEYGYRSVSCLTVPLQNDDVFGVLQLMNMHDRATGAVIPFDAYHQLLVESLATQLAVVLHNHLLRRRQVGLERMERELLIGRQLQEGFFPDVLPQADGWEFAAHFESALEVAGDFYDVFPMPRGKIAFVVADVCGKGVAAALFMALVRSLVRAYAQRHFYLHTAEPRPAALHTPPGVATEDVLTLLEVVQLTNAYIVNNHRQTHMFATLFVGVLEPTTGDLLAVNAGHEPPLLLRADGTLQPLAPTGRAIGLTSQSTYTVATERLAPGDVLLAYTDGVTEAQDGERALFGRNTLHALVAAAGHNGYGPSAESLLAAVRQAVRDHSGPRRLTDDVTLLAVRRLPA